MAHGSTETLLCQLAFITLITRGECDYSTRLAKYGIFVSCQKNNGWSRGRLSYEVQTVQHKIMFRSYTRLKKNNKGLCCVYCCQLSAFFYFFLFLIKMSLYSFPEKDHRVHLKTICTINKSKGFRLRSYHFLHTFHELIHPCSSRRRQSENVVMKQS